jgi:hypothetical protein
MGTSEDAQRENGPAPQHAGGLGSDRRDNSGTAYLSVTFVVGGAPAPPCLHPSPDGRACSGRFFVWQRLVVVATVKVLCRTEV